MGIKLGNICKFQSGGTPTKKNPAYFNGTIPWITTTALNGRKIGKENAVDWISEKAIEESAAKIVPAFSIMVGTRVGIGKVAINTVDMSTSQDIVSLVDIDESAWNKEFICKFLQGKSKFLNAQARGATIKGIKIDVLSALELPKISIEEQIYISKVIDEVKIIINSRKQQLEKLDKIVKARFVEMFGDPRSNPFGFPKSMLKDTCKVVTGNTPPRAAQEYYGDYVEWIKTDNIVPEMINPTKATESLSEEGIKVGRTVGKNSILMACIAGSIASIGKVCVTDRTVAFNQQINAVISKEYNILFLYVMLQLSKDYLVEEINMSLKGILSKSKLEEKEFIVPPIDLQEQFAEFVEQVDKSKDSVKKALDEAQLLFDSLMQQYFG